MVAAGVRVLVGRVRHDHDGARHAREDRLGLRRRSAPSSCRPEVSPPGRQTAAGTGAGAAFGAAVCRLGMAFFGVAFCLGASTVTGGKGWAGDCACAVWQMAATASMDRMAAAVICKRRPLVSGRACDSRTEGMELPQRIKCTRCATRTATLRDDQARAGGPRAGGHTGWWCVAKE